MQKKHLIGYAATTVVAMSVGGGLGSAGDTSTLTTATPTTTATVTQTVTTQSTMMPVPTWLQVRLSQLMRGTVALGLACALGVAAPATASAEDNTHIPATCDSERWYPGPEYCDNLPWVISVEQECRMLWAAKSEWVRHDRVCKMYRPHRKIRKAENRPRRTVTR